MPIAVGNKPKVLFISNTSGSPIHDAKIREVAEVHCLEGMNYEDTVPVLAQVVRDHGPFDAFGGLFTMTGKFPMRWDEGLLGPLAPHCKLYVGPGAGYDKVDIDWVSSTGAYYANSPLAVGKRTADGTLMLILAALRGLTPQDLSVRAGGWRDMSVRSINWREATIGIVGLGNIGTQVADMCTGLGMKVIYTSRRKKDVPYDWVSFEDLLARSDCVVLLCPLSKETYHLMNAESFAKCKRGTILVNVARGPVVDEEALVQALESGQVMRAALDVFENEPSVHPKLRANPNVTLSPHVAPAPDSMSSGMNAEVIDNILHYFETGLPQTPVNQAEADAGRAKLSIIPAPASTVSTAPLTA